MAKYHDTTEEDIWGDEAKVSRLYRTFEGEFQVLQIWEEIRTWEDIVFTEIPLCAVSDADSDAEYDTAEEAPVSLPASDASSADDSPDSP